MQTYQFPGQTGFYKGKVRDVYFINSDKLLMIASDRISAFDVILPKSIPFKGQILNQLAAFMLEACKDICPVWLKGTPTPNSSVGIRCEPFKVEFVVRGYLTGHAWRTYASGKRNLCGIELPEGMIENEKFPHPIITPSTKADAGHDEDTTKEAIVSQNLMTIAEWESVAAHAINLFSRGTEIAAKQRLILVDTKYEFGKKDGVIYIMDEIHTPDSSRYFYTDDYEEAQKAGAKQKQLSKEFVREWLIENNFMGKVGEQVPEMSEEWVNTIQKRYIELYETLIGESFHAQSFTEEEIFDNCTKALELY